MAATVGRPSRRGARARPSPTSVRLAIAVPAALAAVGLALPILALVLHTTPGKLAGALSDPVVGDALRVSLEATALSLAAVMALGTPLAVALARGRFPGRAALDALVGVPLVLPPVVAGLALLIALGRTGPYHDALDVLGLHVPLTFAAVVVAQAFVSLPYYVYALSAGLARVDRGLEEMAASLGAGPWRVLLTVTLPQVRVALLSGAVLSAARSLGEFGATVTVAGNLQGRTQTMPSAIYIAFESDPDGAVALAVLLAAASFAVLLAVRGPRAALGTG